MSQGILESQFGGLQTLFVDSINEGLHADSRTAMADAVTGWLIGTARKKPIQDLQERLREMGLRIGRMMESIRFAMRGEDIVVIADGPGEETLKALANGTNWFDPCDGIVSIMISALRDS